MSEPCSSIGQRCRVSHVLGLDNLEKRAFTSDVQQCWHANLYVRFGQKKGVSQTVGSVHSRVSESLSMVGQAPRTNHLVRLDKCLE